MPNWLTTSWEIIVSVAPVSGIASTSTKFEPQLLKILTLMGGVELEPFTHELAATNEVRTIGDGDRGLLE